MRNQGLQAKLLSLSNLLSAACSHELYILYKETQSLQRQLSLGMPQSLGKATLLWLGAVFFFVKAQEDSSLIGEIQGDQKQITQTKLATNFSKCLFEVF